MRPFGQVFEQFMIVWHRYTCPHKPVAECQSHVGRCYQIRGEKLAVDFVRADLERVVHILEALLGVLVTRVGDPAEGLHQHRRAQVLVRVPPVACRKNHSSAINFQFVLIIQPEPEPEQMEMKEAERARLWRRGRVCVEGFRTGA